MKSLGLCIGASNISLALLKKKEKQVTVIDTKTIPHEGHPLEVLKKIYEDYAIHTLDKVAITGRKFRHMMNTSKISEAEAVEYAYQFHKNTFNNVDIILSAGGETFLAYELDQMGRIINVYTGNKCASGTGEFFLQQIKRMDLSLNDAMAINPEGKSYKVSGRCSVFCKSDCTHALNKGTPKSDIVAGLCEMMSRKLLELIPRKHTGHILLIGGTSQNTKVVEALNQHAEIIVPSYAYCYEAFGTALWALEHTTKAISSMDAFFNRKTTSFTYLPDLRKAESLVTFKDSTKSVLVENDTCILGIDVGSTTTKAVLLRERDNTVVANCYLRTNGDPIKATKECYQSILSQIDQPIQIRGLGVTGSGRQIVGLHALTPSVMNEIIAHATAATYYEKDVDTIFEIGGQDAKYTYITNGVPSDYAMNEACSAGTGSFLEEAAKESLDVAMYQIESLALNGLQPPNFSDQCAAFISSDIKTAIQEGIPTENILAGLVYSICMNYLNRVKGTRKVGQTICMQGGVCYNKAVPIAMAALTGKKIIVPPDPGLMGAFGAALETKKKINLGLLKSQDFNLLTLANREVLYQSPFTCLGGKEHCDRKCAINRIVIEGKTYPFGGACSKYEGLYLQNQRQPSSPELNLVAYREQMVYKDYSENYAKRVLPANHKKIGILRSLLTTSLYPLYYNFFYALGYDVVSSDHIDPTSTQNKGAAFCYPVEVAHGLLGTLLNEPLDLIFLPHVKSIPGALDTSVTCPFVQGEPYYLKTSFHLLKDKRILSPVIDFRENYSSEKNTFIQLGLSLGFKKHEAEKAFDIAIKAQRDFHKECHKIGEMVLRRLNKEPSTIGIALFGRPYNAFSSISNMGIPKKFSSRNYYVIPIDFLPYEDENCFDNMYWAMGQMIIKAAEYVKKHPKLFGSYITNFSCGPDSFILNYFRTIMADKPSLTLELDSHTADAGIDTRIEAFLDIVKSYQMHKNEQQASITNQYRPATTIVENNVLHVIDSKGGKYPLSSEKVHVLIPSMGDIGSKLLAASFRYVGIKATALHPATENELKKGLSYTTCKECMPLMLTIGSLMDYLDKRQSNDELIVYFMPETSGPCRFGQYNILMKEIIEKQQIKNVALLSLTSENSYAGLGTHFVLRTWQSIIIADILEDIYSAVLVLSENPIDGLYKYHKVCNRILYSIEKDAWKDLKSNLEIAADDLKDIIRKADISQSKKIGLLGEIFVRRDSFSRQKLVERLAEKDIITKTAPITEWIYYCDYIVKNKLVTKATYKDRMRIRMQQYFKSQYEKTIKKIFATSGFYEYHLVDVSQMIDYVKDLISPKLTGEAILTAGAALTGIIDEVEGIISIGPFGCMPSRIAEAILTKSMDEHKKSATQNPLLIKEIMTKHPHLPFLSIEVDGNVLPQLTETKLDAFCLQVERLHTTLKEHKRINHSLVDPVDRAK